MHLRSIHYYVVILCIVALASLGLVPWQELLSLAPQHVAGLLLLVAFGLLSEGLSVRLSVGAKGSSHTITFIPLLAAVLLFGAAAPVAFILLTGGVAEIFIRKKAPIRAIFNIAQYVVASCLAGWAFEAAGGVALWNTSNFTLQLIPFAVFLVVLMGVNHAAVSLAIALDQALPFREVWATSIGRSGSNALYDVLVSPLAIVVAFAYTGIGWIGLVLSLLPLFFVRHAYLNTFRLEQANRDLLKALVKAIETRDPYTSGHSQRVARLAGGIASHMRLARGKIEVIQMAALLHDIGKIDVLCADILLKPGPLTDADRRIIESHVPKGVDLLRSLASVPEQVITAVETHHEREDGTGYPNGVPGHRIPLGGKIIKVSDAIDAMLSDRPYRSALTVDQVKEELRKGAGQEFDIVVTKCVLESSLVEEHVMAVDGAKGIRAVSAQRKGAGGSWRAPRQKQPRHSAEGTWLLN